MFTFWSPLRDAGSQEWLNHLVIVSMIVQQILIKIGTFTDLASHSQRSER